MGMILPFSPELRTKCGSRNISADTFLFAVVSHIFFCVSQFLLSSIRSVNSGSYIDQFTLTSHTNFVSSVCLLDNGSYICTGSNDSTICVYAYGTVEPVTVLKGHAGTGTF